jgi:preprotein translocase subunit YajC
MSGLLPILLLIPLMYFLILRPQKKRMQEQQAMLSAVAEGDEVVTTAGIYGFVTAVDGDVLWLEIAEGVDIRIAKAAVAKRIPVSADTSRRDEAADDASDDAAAEAADGVADEGSGAAGGEAR